MKQEHALDLWSNAYAYLSCMIGHYSVIKRKKKWNDGKVEKGGKKKVA